MVVMPKQNVPALRLEGFDGEWEESTIGSQAEIVMGQSPHGSSYNTKSAGEVLVQGNADLVDGWVTPRIWTTEPTRIAEPGTLIMSVRAPVGAMGKTRHRVVLGRGVAGIRGNEFIFQYLTKLEQDSYWSSKSSGSTFDSVNGSEIRATQISVPPTLEEQQAIGAIFTNLDAAINQHTLKHKALQQSKTALMQRMFPQEGQTVPELRLEGFSGEWEPVRLDAFDIKTGPFGSTLHAEDYVAVGTPIVTTEHFKSGQLPDTGDSIPQVSKQDTARLSMYLLDEGDIVFSRVGSVDINAQVTRHQEGWLFSGRVLRLRLDASCDAAFLHSALETEQVRTSIISRAVGQTMPSINTKILAATEVFIPPTLEEQQAIGAVFTNLDQLIAAEAQYIASLKQAKTALLQRMFI